MKTVTAAEFVNIVKDYTRSTTIGLCYLVDESQSRTVKGKKQLQKQVCIRSQAYLNHNYTNKVIKLTGDTSFVADPMKGKTRISTTIVQSDKSGAMLLDVKVLGGAKRETTYFHNGNEISRQDAIDNNLFAPSYFDKKKTKGRGTVSVEDNFDTLTVGVDKLVWVNFNNEEYRFYCNRTS